MGNALRWTHEQLAEFQRKAEARGAVRTHICADDAPRRTGVEIEAPKPPKYRNQKTERDGIKFHSKREADRYQELLLMQSAGEISQLERQVPFDLTVNGVKVCRYVADFVYRDKTGERVTEDAKGYATTTYKLKAKLMLAVHGIRVRES